jgi:hypothetical protein
VEETTESACSWLKEQELRNDVCARVLLHWAEDSWKNIPEKLPQALRNDADVVGYLGHFGDNPEYDETAEDNPVCAPKVHLN